MKSRQMSGNTVKIANGERWFKDGVDVNVCLFPSALFGVQEVSAKAPFHPVERTGSTRPHLP